eukprot:SAG31_NODE_4558_length_3138_cov_6.664034_3_plen_78_part_00
MPAMSTGRRRYQNSKSARSSFPSSPARVRESPSASRAAGARAARSSVIRRRAAVRRQQQGISIMYLAPRRAALIDFF